LEKVDDIGILNGILCLCEIREDYFVEWFFRCNLDIGSHGTNLDALFMFLKMLDWISFHL
jgi:hypothetical protein